MQHSITVRECNGSRTYYTADQVEQIISACRTELSMNFDVPAARIIGVYAGKLGLSLDRLKTMLQAGL